MGNMTHTATSEVMPEKELMTDEIARTLCTPALADRLRRYVAEGGAPQAWHVRKAVEEYLDRNGAT